MSASALRQARRVHRRTADIASGAVVPILDQFLPPDQPFHLYYANRAHTPSKLRAFIEFMQAVNWKVPK
jgi:DNA-binding transcriptional LysR family regulator